MTYDTVVAVMIQWCIKGMALTDDNAARTIIDGQGGIVCNWWRQVHIITPQAIRLKLTTPNLDRHVNHFQEIDSATGRPFSELTPFISLSAGTIERDALARTNFARRARRTALWFSTDFGQRNYGYLFTCWVVVSPRPNVEIEGMAEEVRELNVYRRYSAFQTEGEVVAKIIVPDNHIQSCEKWDLTPKRGGFTRAWIHDNPRFTPPERLANVRELI